MEGANGNIASPGTKNTGSHLANNPAPGDKVVKTLSPRPGFTTSARSIATNKIQHPPSCDGKLIPYFLKAFLKR